MTGQDDRWLVKLDLAGAEVWSKSYDASPREQILSLGGGPSSIYAAGSIENSDHDAWSARLDLEGAVLWEDTFASGFGDDYATQVALAPDNGAIVGGLAGLDGGALGLWLRRYAEDGAAKWTRTEPIGPNNNALYPLGPGMHVDETRALLGFWAEAGPDLFPKYLVAYPLSGDSALWSRQLDDGNGAIFGVTAAKNGELVLAVSHMFGALTTMRLSKDADMILWSSGECVGENARAVAVDGQGDIVVVGDGDGQVGKNIRLCKFTAEGALRWGKDIDGGAGDDFGFAVAVAPDDTIIVGGQVADETKVMHGWIAAYSP